MSCSLLNLLEQDIEGIHQSSPQQSRLIDKPWKIGTVLYGLTFFFTPFRCWPIESVLLHPPTGSRRLGYQHSHA